MQMIKKNYKPGLMRLEHLDNKKTTETRLYWIRIGTWGTGDKKIDHEIKRRDGLLPHQQQQQEITW